MRCPTRLLLAALAGLGLGQVTWCAGTEAEPVPLILHPVKDQATLTMLREQTEAEDPLLRLEALEALLHVGDPADGQRIMSLLADPDPRVRQAAVEAAAVLALPLAVDRTQALMRDAEPGVRAALYQGTPRLSEGVSRSDLIAAMDDPEPAVRQAAALTLLRLHAEDAALPDFLQGERDPGVLHQVYPAFLPGAGDERPRWLTWGLEHPDAIVRLAALQGLEQGDQGLASEVVAALEDTSAAVVDAAIAAVSRLQMAETIPACLSLVDDADSLRRVVLCRALASFRDAAAVAGLERELVRGPDPLVHKAAIKGLLQVRSGDAHRALTGSLGHPNPVARSRAAEALGTWGDAAAGPALLALIEDPEPGVREAALIALSTLDFPGSQKALPEVRRLAASGLPAVRAAAFRLLGRRGDPKSAPVIEAVLIDIGPGEAWQPREAAFDALAAMGVDTLYEVALAHLTEEVIPVPPGAIGPLYDRLEVRISALNYLVRFGTPATPQELVSQFAEVPPFPLRVALARQLTALTGRQHLPEPDQDHLSHGVESLGEPAFSPRPAPPGVRPADTLPTI